MCSDLWKEETHIANSSNLSLVKQTLGSVSQMQQEVKTGQTGESTTQTKHRPLKRLQIRTNYSCDIQGLPMRLLLGSRRARSCCNVDPSQHNYQETAKSD